MNAWLAKAVFLLGVAGMGVIRAPHIRRSIKVKIAWHRKSRSDDVLVALVSLGFIIPLVWIPTSVLAFGDHALGAIPFAAGLFCYALGLWLLHQSHVDLGTNWSNTLEMRDQLVTHGVYRRVRHPMYAALLLYGCGQALVLPNWLAGPSFLVAFALLFAIRVGREERMMREQFGKDHEAYAARTKRLVPGVW